MGGTITFTIFFFTGSRSTRTGLRSNGTTLHGTGLSNEGISRLHFASTNASDVGEHNGVDVRFKLGLTLHCPHWRPRQQSLLMCTTFPTQTARTRMRVVRERFYTNVEGEDESGESDSTQSHWAERAKFKFWHFCARNSNFATFWVSCWWHFRNLRNNDSMKLRARYMVITRIVCSWWPCI